MFKSGTPVNDRIIFFNWNYSESASNYVSKREAIPV